MVELNLHIHPKQRTGYFPRLVVDSLGTRLKILTNARAFVAYPEGEDLEVVLRSLWLIIQDLEFRIDLTKRNPDPKKEALLK